MTTRAESVNGTLTINRNPVFGYVPAGPISTGRVNPINSINIISIVKLNPLAGQRVIDCFHIYLLKLDSLIQ
jgi:hypothetical protein